MLRLFILLTSSLLIFSCSENKSAKTQKRVVLQEELKSIADNESETNVLIELIETFNLQLCDGSADKNIKDCYEMNAKGLQSDFLQNLPYTINFPYNDKFDLSTINNIDELSFLSKKCGFVKESGETINYHCLKSESKFMDYIHQIRNESGMINLFIDTYKEQKTITPELRKEMILSANTKLNFDLQSHRLFYMIFHVMCNEERMASNKL